MNIKLLLLALVSALVVGCAHQRISDAEPIDRALKICGLGIDAKSADAYKAALESLSGKSSVSFGSEASEAIETQIGILLKQADLKSDSGVRTVAEEMRATRECVLRQVELMRPASKSELLEQCRLDVQRRISPAGSLMYGLLRNWNQASGLLTDSEVVAMNGFFDRGGTSSFDLRALCDIRGGKFNESVIEATK